MDLPSNLFSDSDFSWTLKMRRGDAAAFFAPSDPSGKLLRKRRRALAKHPTRYTASTPRGDQLVVQCWELARRWEHLADPDKAPTLLNLGAQWEADFLLMDQGSSALAGGCVCFPSSWNLGESAGLTLFDVHQRVPGLNRQIGEKIEKFLDRLPDNEPFFRENWGLTRSAHLNYHPDKKRPALDETIDKNCVFLRLEHQAFLKLNGGVLMGIRIDPISFPDLAENYPDPAKNLLRQLETMPEEVARYKNLSRGKSAAETILKELLEKSGKARQ